MRRCLSPSLFWRHHALPVPEARASLMPLAQAARPSALSGGILRGRFKMWSGSRSAAWPWAGGGYSRLHTEPDAATRSAAAVGVVRWLPAGLRDLPAPHEAGAEAEATSTASPRITAGTIGEHSTLVEAATEGRLLRVLRQLPGRRYRWAVIDALGQEWRISTGTVRFAIGGVPQPSDPALVVRELAEIQLAAAKLVESVQGQNRVAALWQSLVERGVETPSPEDVRAWLWPNGLNRERCEGQSPPGSGGKQGQDADQLSIPTSPPPPPSSSLSSSQSRDMASELYAAHRVLNENHEYFMRVDGEYRTRPPAEREGIAVEKRLFDPKSKQLLLFLLRLDKKRRARREQRRRKKAGDLSAATALGEEEQSGRAHPPGSETLAGDSTHVSHLPAGFSMDVNSIRPLLSATELADAEWWDPHNRDAVRMAFLKRYALTQDFGNSTSPYVRDAVLRPLGYRGSSGDAFSLLVELEMFDEFANLHQLRATHLGIQDLGTRRPGPVAASRASPFRHQLTQRPGRRTDVQYHTVYTIDDASTTEVDDGISVEWQTGGSTGPNNWVFVHIADPTSWIPVDHEVDRHARDRVSTIYLPETVVPMLQPSIYRHFSLEPRRDNYVLTFAFKIGSVDGAIEDYTISPSIISRVKKLTYRQVDAVLAQVPGGQASRHTSQSLLADQDKEALLHLHELALLRKRWRLSQGAKEIFLAKPLVKVINTPHMRRVSVSLEEPMTPARELVAEMMIAANQVAGLYAAQHGLFVPYRHQAAPNEVDPDLLRELDSLPEHIKYAELVRHMQTAEMSLVPKRHTSLGLDTYVQVTSPIRRFTDMIAHRQITAHLGHTAPPYSSETLSVDYLPHIRRRLQHISELVQQTNSFWVLQNFMRTSWRKRWEALVVRIEEEPTDRYPFFLVRAYFTELGWSRTIRLPQRPHRGEVIQLQLQHVSPHADSITFKQVA